MNWNSTDKYLLLYLTNDCYVVETWFNEKIDQLNNRV